MFLLKTLGEVIKDPQQAVVMADWLEEFRSDKPEVTAYIRWLRNWKKLRLTTLIDVVAKFGDEEERSLIRKLVNMGFSLIRGRKRQRGEIRSKSLQVSKRNTLARMLNQLIELA